jgi:hypothetical protein
MSLIRQKSNEVLKGAAAIKGMIFQGRQMTDHPKQLQRESGRARLRVLRRRFRRDKSGAVALVFGLILAPVLLFVAVALDYSRTTADRATFQSAIDAAVLAASRQKLPDDQRTRIAEELFRGRLTAAQRQQIKELAFVLDAANNKVTGRVDAETATTIMNVGGFTVMPFAASAEGIIARPIVRQLDLAMCIDASKSMDATLNSVKANALDFEANLNAELQNRGVDPFDAMRVRVIFFRDYGGTYDAAGPAYYNPYSTTGTWVWQKDQWVWADPTDPNRFRYVGDNPPMRASQFWNLPADRSLFSNFVQTETAWGGGDAPESGLECVNEAMDSAWARVGDLTPDGKKLDQVYPIVAVWTMSEVHPPDWPRSLLHPEYPSSSKMPRTHTGLLGKWNDPIKIDQLNRMLVFFGNPITPEDGKGGDPNGWQPVSKWPGFLQGGTLTQGTNSLVLKIADAIIAKLRTPVLSQ